MSNIARTDTSFFSPFRTVLFFLLIAIAGCLAIPRLSVDLLPAQKSNQLIISFSIAGSPDIVEQKVTSTLEGAFSQLSQLKSISSNSGYHSGTIRLQFDKTADMEYKQFELTSIIRRIYPQLPEGTSYPVIARSSDRRENNSTILAYSINARQQPFEIRNNVEQTLQKSLAAFPGISAVSVSGTENLQVTVQYDAQKCFVLGVTRSVIHNAVEALAGQSFPGVITRETGEAMFLEVPSPLRRLSDIENLPVSTPRGVAVRLKDVSKVYFEEQEPQSFFRIDGKNSVTMNIVAREGVNRIDLAHKVKAVISKAAGQLPVGYDVKLAYDDTVFLEKEMSKNYSRVGLSIAILFVFTLLSYRSWRYFLILFAGLGVNVLLTALLSYVFNINIHLYTISGLAISFGIMMDNAIIILDYYHQFRNRKVLPALLGSTLTTIAALLMVFFLPEEERGNLVDFAIVVILSLCSSLAIAWWLIPALYNLLLPFPVWGPRISRVSVRTINKRRTAELYFRLIGSLAKFRVSCMIVLILLFGIPLFLLPEKWEGDQWYHKWYNQTFGSETYQERVRPTAEKWLGGALRQFVNNVYERSGYRSPEKTKLYVTAELPFGHTIEQMNHILSGFESYLAKENGIDTYITNVFSGQEGAIEISFQPEAEYSLYPYQLKSRLIGRSLDWGGVSWNIFGVGQGFNNANNSEVPSFLVKMKGYNYEELERQAKLLSNKLLKYERVKNININDRLNERQKAGQEFVLMLDDSKLALNGTNKADVFESIRQLAKPDMTGVRVALDNRYYPVNIREKESESYSRHDLLNEYLHIDSTKRVKLGDFSSLVILPTSNSIIREDRQYIRGVSFEYLGSGEFGGKYLDQVLKVMKQEMPLGYTAEKISWRWDWSKSKSKYFVIFLLLISIYFICSILFENLKQPFYIIMMIPLSFIGSFLTFAWGDFYFDQGGYAAFIMLGGLVVNAAIFIINDYNDLRSRFNEADPNRLLIQAATNRSRTIFLTVLSSCFGLIPFLTEGQHEVFWFPLAVGTIGGLICSLPVVFIVLPVLLWRKKNRD